jgi:hypothetical protein
VVAKLWERTHAPEAARGAGKSTVENDRPAGQRSQKDEMRQIARPEAG